MNERYADRHFTVRDGLRLHYRDYPGDAARPPLLCLPGLTRNSRDFAKLAERYSPRFRVLALDFRGRGGSDYDPVPARYVPPTYAQDVVEMLDRLTIPKAIFVGTSLGGLVTMGLAALAPRRLHAAILNDIGPEIAESGIARIRSYVGRDVRFPSWEEAGAAIAANTGRAFANYATDDWIAMAKRNCREEDGEIRFDYDMAIALPFATATAASQIDMWQLFAALAERPLLVVRGENSDLLTAETAEKMMTAAPRMTLALVPGVGHSPDLSEPAAIAAIDAFLGELEPCA